MSQSHRKTHDPTGELRPRPVRDRPPPMVCHAGSPLTRRAGEERGLRRKAFKGIARALAATTTAATKPSPPSAPPAFPVWAVGVGQSEAAPASAPPDEPLRYFCRDLRGRKHDIKRLRTQRHRAVCKGMTFMHRFLRRNNYEALHDIGDDAPAIFFEIWYTSADSRIRARARAIARELLTKFERRLLRTTAGGGPRLPNRDDFFALMFLARMRREMGDQAECDVLLERADEAWAGRGYSSTAELFGVGREALGVVSTDDWLVLLMRILIMEYNGLLFPKRFPLQWGMRDALLALRCLKLDGPGQPDFHHSFYLATHIVYALSAYCSIKISEQDCPWLFRYLRVSMVHWMRKAWQRDRVLKRAARAARAVVACAAAPEGGLPHDIMALGPAVAEQELGEGEEEEQDEDEDDDQHCDRDMKQEGGGGGGGGVGIIRPRTAAGARAGRGTGASGKDMVDVLALAVRSDGGVVRLEGSVGCYGGGDADSPRPAGRGRAGSSDVSGPCDDAHGEESMREGLEAAEQKRPPGAREPEDEGAQCGGGRKKEVMQWDAASGGAVGVIGGKMAAPADAVPMTADNDGSDDITAATHRAGAGQPMIAEISQHTMIGIGPTYRAGGASGLGGLSAGDDDDDDDGGAGAGTGDSDSAPITKATTAAPTKTKISAAEAEVLVAEDEEANYVHVDVDGVSEIVDNLRSCGLTAASDRMVCEGSMWLLQVQRRDGSFPFWTAKGPAAEAAEGSSFYDLLHPSWVAVQALRDRDFKLNRPEADEWKAWIGRLVRETRFAALQYRPPWLVKGVARRRVANRVASRVTTKTKAKAKSKRPSAAKRRPDAAAHVK